MSTTRNTSSPKPFTPGYSQPAASRFAASNGDNDIPSSAARPASLKPQSMNMHAAFQLVSDTSTTDTTVRQQSASFSGPVGSASAPASSTKQRGATVDGVEPGGCSNGLKPVRSCRNQYARSHPVHDTISDSFR